MRALALLPLFCSAILPLRAQQPGPAPVVTAVRFQPGQLVERVVSSLDRSQQYAVYLPSSYRTDRKWPVLLLLDPRGRALVPMELVQAAAERLGFLTLSSYNTSSDGSDQPNIDAMAAMLTDAQRHFAIDPGRFYLVGFSGTARVAWNFAYGLQGTVAGILGFGAGVPPDFQFTPPGGGGPVPLAYYGGCGNRDFNYEELLALDDEMDRLGVTHRLQYYNGPHAWPPVRVMEDGIDWIQLQAMKRGLAATDSGWVDSLFRAGLNQADSLQSAGQTFAAFRRYRALATDFKGVHQVSAIESKVSQLEKSKVVREALQDQHELIEQNHAYLRNVARFLEDFRKAKNPPDVERSLKMLKVAQLKRVRADSSDSLTAQAAGRILDQLRVFAAVYEPHDYLEKGDAIRTLAILDIAEAVSPGPGICYTRARALALLKRSEEAVQALECWARRARPDPAALLANTELAGLHGQPAFDAFITRLKQEGPPPPSP